MLRLGCRHVFRNTRVALALIPAKPHWNWLGLSLASHGVLHANKRRCLGTLLGPGVQGKAETCPADSKVQAAALARLRPHLPSFLRQHTLRTTAVSLEVVSESRSVPPGKQVEQDQAHIELREPCER